MKSNYTLVWSFRNRFEELSKSILSADIYFPKEVNFCLIDASSTDETITTNDQELYTIMKGIRSWGRYCSCKQCCIRSELPNVFCPQNKYTRNSDLPSDYIVNYQYEWLGYNLKPLELQAAILTEQLKKLDSFTEQRRANYFKLLDFFKKNKFDVSVWDLPKGISPFAFPILVSPCKRKRIVSELNRSGVETRFLFGGNLVRHPAYQNCSSYWEKLDNLSNSDLITESCLMFGVSQVNDLATMELMIEKIDKVFRNMGV